MHAAGEVWGREAELVSHCVMGCLAAELSLATCFSDTVFVTLFRTAAETAISRVHKLLGTGGVPIFLTLFRWWLMVSEVIMGHSAGMGYSYATDPPFSPSV